MEADGLRGAGLLDIGALPEMIDAGRLVDDALSADDLVAYTRRQLQSQPRMHRFLEQSGAGQNMAARLAG